MARETKVGLIVGLGLILFVSIMVSEYFVDTPTDEQINPEALSDFNNSTSNGTPPQLVRTPNTNETVDPRQDPQYLAAMTYEEMQRRRVLPDIDEEAVTPPFPQHGLERGTTHTGNQVTIGGNSNRGISISPIDDPHQATGHQLQVRQGPNAHSTEMVTGVEIVDLEASSNRNRQVRHIVRAGENISAIARRYYDGDANMWQSIRDANPGKVGPNGEIREGASLLIPQRNIARADPTEGLQELVGANGTGENAPPRPQVRIITVQDGDTLSGLAAEHLGSAGKWQQIMAVNTDTLESDRDLRVGMRLRIPTRETVQLIEEAERALANGGETPGNNSGEAGGTGQRAGDNSVTGRTYTVRENDSLYRIAQELLGNGNRYEEIYDANRDRLSSPTAIRPGMTLVIPEH